MIIEIGYTYHLDKDSPAQQSWTYFYIKDDDLKKVKTKARTYWKKFISDNGWGRKAKITHIEPIKNEKTYTPDFIIVGRNELPAARKRRSSPKKQTSARSSTSSRSRKSSVSKQRSKNSVPNQA